MARQTSICGEFASQLLDPVRVNKLLTQFQESEASATPRLDVVANQMNDVCYRDRLTGRPIEMCRHALQQHEWMVVDQDTKNACSIPSKLYDPF